MNTPNETQPIVAKAPRENKNFLNTQIQTLREKGFSSCKQAIIVSSKTQTAYLVDYHRNITKVYPVSTAKNRTDEEFLIGQPASHGCIRMKNDDIIELFSLVKHRTKVQIA